MGAAGCPVSASLSMVVLSSIAATTSAAIRRRNSIGMPRDRRSYPIVDGNELDLAGLRVVAHRGVGLHRQLDPVFAEIDRRRGDIAVRRLGDRQSVFLDEAVEDEFGECRRD